MKLPWLLKSAACGALPIASFRLIAMERLGEVAFSLEFSLERLRICESSLPSSVHGDWRMLVAAELWLAAGSRTGFDASPIAKHLAGTRPFGANTPVIGDLLGNRVAAALIPLKTDHLDRAPGIAQIWITSGDTLPPRRPDPSLEGCETLLASANLTNPQVFVTSSLGSNATFEGPSWQLGGALAALALATRDSDAIRRLACDWIATGEVTNLAVKQVPVGNKLAVSTWRKWLLPEENRRDAEKHLCKKPYHPASRVDNAWRVVSNRGTALAEAESWPTNVSVLHSLASFGMRPVVASVLLCHPKRLVLWHSTDPTSKEAAARIKETVEALKVGGHLDAAMTVDFPFKEISSSNLAEAENQVRAGLFPTLADDGLVLFNTTPGNFLMKLAVHNEALPFSGTPTSKVWLVYRDFDCEGVGFTAIRYSGTLPETLTLSPKDLLPILKKFLPRQPSRPLETVESMLKDLVVEPSPKLDVICRADPTSLLKFQIGPVQEFIAQARKTLDLWAGSWLLSHLTRVGTKALKDAGGVELLYPELDEQADRLAASTPNIFLARVPTDEAVSLAKKVERAIREEWNRIATAVHVLLGKHAAPGWDAGWPQQVERFPTVDWIIHPCGDDSEVLALRERCEPPLPSNAPNFKKAGACLDGLHIAHAEWRFAARKNARSFAGWKGGPVPKDHLDGFREVMGGTDHEAFWRGLRSGQFKHALKGEQLYGAMTLIKRLFPEAYLRDELKWNPLKPSFDSVQHIAAAIDAEEGEVPPGSPTYYAILALDGDDMGQWVSGCQGTRGDLDPLQPGYQGKLSQKLSAFAAAVPDIMQRHGGQAIYCGGDDVLAMLPAAQALKCAQDLAGVFSQHLPGGTASVGIAIGHVRAPLQDSIQAAREAEKAAKAVPGKNAFCLRILKRSGEHVQIAARWDSGAMLVWDELWQMSADGEVSGRFAHRYAALLKRLLACSLRDNDHGWEPEWPDGTRDAAEAELRHVLSQQAGKTEKEAIRTAERWRPCLNSLSPRDYLHFWLAWAFLRRIGDPLENSLLADS